MTGVILDVTERHDVPLMVTRGYSSLSFLHSAAEAIAAQDKPAHLYYLGDHDPSGLDIPEQVERRLREFAPESDIHFERLAVLPVQIDAWGLPTRPTKQTDSRSRGFVGGSVEVEAIPAATLRDLVDEAITEHLDPAVLQRTQQIEEAEREALTQFVKRWNAEAGEAGEGGSPASL